MPVEAVYSYIVKDTQARLVWVTKSRQRADSGFSVTSTSWSHVVSSYYCTIMCILLIPIKQTDGVFEEVCSLCNLPAYK